MAGSPQKERYSSGDKPRRKSGSRARGDGEGEGRRRRESGSPEKRDGEVEERVKRHSVDPEERAKRRSGEPRERGEKSKSRSPEKRFEGKVVDGRAKRRSGDPREGRGEKSKSRSPEKRYSVDPTDERVKRRSVDPTDERMKRRSGEKSKSRSPEKRTSKTIAVENERESYTPSQLTTTNALSMDSLAKLNQLNEKQELSHKERAAEREHKEKVVTGKIVKDWHRRRDSEARRKKRIVSGAMMEEGRGRRGGWLSKDDPALRRKRLWLLAGGALALLLIILIPVGVLVVGKQNNNGGGGSPAGAAGSGGPDNSNLNGINPNDIPSSAKGSILDPFTWYDTHDFNVTYTNETYGGLPIMGLNSTWEDSVQANKYVPPLDQKFAYGKMPIRGINVGGWLALEPFITPSLFSSYTANLGIVDEYTLTKHLGPAAAAQTIEQHYSSFINEQSFADIQAAGFDHVRIPYSYWAVTTFPGDPYVPKISWRYLLRGIEYARKYGLRVNLDLHAVPGSQNGWNHSGRQGSIGWINGTDGMLNAQRALDIHNQLSAFFAQPRYANVVGIYGLLNEPRMTMLPIQPVLDWTTSAISIIRKNGIKQTIVFGDGFLGLPNWQGKLAGIENIVMDAHQYVIFNVDQIAFTHQTKLNFACSGWTAQMQQSINPATG